MIITNLHQTFIIMRDHIAVEIIPYNTSRSIGIATVVLRTRAGRSRQRQLKYSAKKIAIWHERDARASEKKIINSAKKLLYFVFLGSTKAKCDPYQFYQS